MIPPTRRALEDAWAVIRCVLLPLAVLLICVVTVMMLAGGCSSADVEAQEAEAEPFDGRFEWHMTGMSSTYVLVDHETGVCYLARKKGGMCVMVGADGEPVTVGEIGGTDGTSDR